MQGQDGAPTSLHVIQRHPTYYFEDGNMIILVEDILFCIHRYLLRKHSPVFDSMLTLPQSEQTQSVEGSTDSNPIVLEQVQSTDFANLMWMLYDERFDKDPASCRSSAKWQSILSLSHRWDMVSIRSAALDALSSCSPPLDPVDKLSICSLYQIEKTWALDAFVSLVKRNKKLSIAEGRKIGVDCTVILADAREDLAMSRAIGPGNMSWISPAQGDVYERTVKNAIQRAEKTTSEESSPAHPMHPLYMGGGGAGGGNHAHWFPPDYTGTGLGLVNQN